MVPFYGNGSLFLHPFLRTYVASSTSKERWIFIAFLLTSATLYSLVQSFLVIGERTVLTMYLPYLGYYLLGYQLKIFAEKKISKVTFGLIAITSYLCLAGGTLLLMHFLGYPKGLYLYNYLSIPVICMSVSVFMLVKEIFPTIEKVPSHLHGPIRKIAPMSLGIYLIHPLIIIFINKMGLTMDNRFPPLCCYNCGTYIYCVFLHNLTLCKRIPYVRRTII